MREGKKNIFKKVYFPLWWIQNSPATEHKAIIKRQGEWEEKLSTKSIHSNLINEYYGFLSPALLRTCLLSLSLPLCLSLSSHSIYCLTGKVICLISFHLNIPLLYFYAFAFSLMPQTHNNSEFQLVFSQKFSENLITRFR